VSAVGVSHTVAVEWPRDAVALVTFSDPERDNRLCWAAVDELGARLAGCRESGARVVVLASGLAGHWLQHAWLPDLCAGLEGGELTGTGAGWFDCQAELSHPDVVSIAAIAGDSSGGGAELGWACDLRIAEPGCMFSQPEVSMGLTTGIGGCSRLLRLAGRGPATDMVLTGDPVSARRLFELGAVSRLAGEGEALAAALDLAERVAARSPAALAGLKRILADCGDSPLAEALAGEQAVFQSVATGERALAEMKRVQAAYESGDH